MRAQARKQSTQAKTQSDVDLTDNELVQLFSEIYYYNYCVVPLPQMRSGNQYILTIICTTTRFPEAVILYCLE